MQKVSVYIDGANFLYGIRSINERYTDFKFDFRKYVAKLTKDRILVDVYYYNASLKQDPNPELFKRQQQFFDKLRHLEKFHVILCKRQRRTTKEGGDSYTIKGDDIHLALDMLRDAYDNKYDVAILISGDGDFTPLVRYVKALGKSVEACYFSKNISLELLKECNRSMVIDKKTVNEFFLREAQRTLGDTEAGHVIKDLLGKKG